MRNYIILLEHYILNMCIKAKHKNKSEIKNKNTSGWKVMF